jgi:SAM-dependent methyltransferase
VPINSAQLNRLCNFEDWDDPALQATMRRVLSNFAKAYPHYPKGIEHRKAWEYAHVLNGLERLGAIRPESMLLSVAGGHEETAYYLTTLVRWVFLVDIYGVGGFSGSEAQTTVLTDPDKFASIPYNRNRLVVQYMNALDLRFEENTFDGVFCMSSIEHFGGVSGAVESLKQMHRVLKPGGIAAITTECVVNGAPVFDQPGLCLFTPAMIEDLTKSVPGLSLVEPVDFTITQRSLQTSYPLTKAIEDIARGHTEYPHIVVELEGRQFTSIALFFRKQ